MKRLIDVLLSGLGLIILSPLFIIIGILIKLDSKGPIIFKQNRVGKAEKVFTLYKFRTIKPNPSVHTFLENQINELPQDIFEKDKPDELPQYKCNKKNMSLLTQTSIYNQYISFPS